MRLSLQEFLLILTVICFGLGIAVWVEDYAPSVLLGAVVVLVGLLAARRHDKALLVETVIFGALWALSIFAVPMLYRAANELSLKSIYSEEAIRLGHLIWGGTVAAFALLPAAAGLCRGKKSPAYLRFATVWVCLTMVGAAFLGMDEAGNAITLWTGSVLCFIGTACISEHLRARKWLGLLLGVVLWMCGTMLVAAVTWVCLFFE